jgi:DNA-binding NarL/FixJ family response regulator
VLFRSEEAERRAQDYRNSHALVVSDGHSSPEQRLKDGPPLSKRELEVLQLLVRGHTYADVANALGIAEGTVQTYVKRIYEKMDVSTKAEAALIAVSRGLVRP